MTALLTLPFALPLLAAAAGVLPRNRLALQRVVTGLLLASALGIAGTLLVGSIPGVWLGAHIATRMPQDLLSGAPSNVDAKQLKELHIKTDLPAAK